MRKERQNYRFQTLDSWRGICASFIVLYHINTYVISHANDLGIINNAYLFVDFFFVLSGFVMSASYERRLLEGFSSKDYIFLRLGRLYPLHLFVLIAFVILESTKVFFDAKTPLFGVDLMGIPALVGNLFLIHGMGVFNYLSWNFPSWSISVEFYTYVLYAFTLLVFHHRIWIAAFFVILSAPLAFLYLGKQNLDITYDYGFLRCLYGFSAGILCWKMYNLVSSLKDKNSMFFSVLEIISIVFVVVFVAIYGENKISLLAPFVFSAALIVFALERGLISDMLRLKPFQWLGILSYSVYMTHVLVRYMLIQCAKLFEKIAGTPVFHSISINGTGREVVGSAQWQGDLIQIGVFLIVLAVSYGTYKLVEQPCNNWARSYIARKTHKTAPVAQSAAF